MLLMGNRQAAIEIQRIERIRAQLATYLERVSNHIGNIQIGNNTSFPYGWRRSAKGRTVWRILEESINQNLELMYANSNDVQFMPSDSEVAMYDFKATGMNNGAPDWTAYVNIKSSTLGIASSKDDLSKADKILAFLKEDPSRTFFIATFGIRFNEDMSISLPECSVFPLAWLPDIYVNPSNNGNLQSSKYKNLDGAVRRTNEQFIVELESAIEVATQKKRSRR